MAPESTGGDPFGHIHGRRFSVTKSGLYRVGFRVLDVSTNGPAGGPIHTASETTARLFSGEVTITQVEPDVDHTHVTFGAMAGYSWQLQSKGSFSDAVWTRGRMPVTGN